jgi:small subunit ribosomal protein YMR-31
MMPTATLRQAAVHAERTPMIRFLGRRTIPSSLDHSPQPHPASPSGKLPQGFGNGYNSTGTKHNSFSSYRDHAQQFGPLQNSIKEGGIGGQAGSQLGSVQPPKGIFFDRSQLPNRFKRLPIDPAEMEAVDSGGAAVFN